MKRKYLFAIFALLIFSCETTDLDIDDNDDNEMDSACLLRSIKSSDGSLTTHTFNNDDVLIRADKFLNDELQEYSLYAYDLQGRFVEEKFFDTLSVVLGVRFFEYDVNDQVILERVESSDNSLVVEWKFNWTSDGLVSEAVLTIPDGNGGTTATDIRYSYDSVNVNVIEERYSQNGNTIGRIEYQYDNKFSAFTGLEFQSFPQRNMVNNPIRITRYDALDEVVDEIISKYEYQFAGCDDYPSFEERVSLGLDQTIFYGY